MLSILAKKNIQKAIKRLESAKKKNEKIVLWGDYDADGISGTLILYEGLKELGFGNFSIFLSGRKGIYDRGEEEIERFAVEGISLVIAIDFGVLANKEIEFARKKKVDFIVLDHHEPSKVFPKGIIINHFKGDKAAAGVVLELVKSFYRQTKKPVKEIEKFFDLAAIAIVADRIVLTKANRKIVSEGAKRINQGCRPAILALAKKIGIKKLTPEKFKMIVSRINFPKGISEENNLFRLMSVKDKKGAEDLAEELELNYQEVQKIIGKILEDNAVELGAKDLPNIIFVENNVHWSLPGINGVIAEEISDKLGRPVFVYSHAGDKIKASGRAQKGENLVRALRVCPAALFFNAGGHPRAVGFKSPKDNLEKIKECLKRYYE